MKQTLLAVAAVSAMLVTQFAQAQGPAPRAQTPEPAPQVETPAPQVEMPAPQDGTTDNTLRLQQIKEAIRQQDQKRKGAIGGIVTGAVLIAVGVIASSLKTAENQEEAEEAYYNGESDDPNDYDVEIGAALAGVAIGVPIIVMSVVSKSKANRKKQELNRERIRLGVAPAGVNGTEATMVTLRYDF